MSQPAHIDHEELLVEITRYLAAVDLYRAENCEPTWRPESTVLRNVQNGPRARAERTPSAH
jgi:hypothetical protein